MFYDESSFEFAIIEECVSLRHLFVYISAELNLSHNKITTLHEQLSDLSHLRVLNMAHNNLSMVPFAAAKMPALEELDLSNNRIDSKYSAK